MSKTYATVIAKAVLGVTAILPKWLRVATLARLSSKLIPHVTVETARGKLTLYTPSKTAVYWPKCAFAAEPDTLRWIDSFPDGAVLWDIGANVGAYAMYAALRDDVRVFAFEPNPHTFICLTNNIYINRLDNRVSGFCIALAEAPRIGGFHMPSHEAGTVGSAFGDPGTSTVDGVNDNVFVSAMAMSIDALAEMDGIRFPTHIKIDVDSIEDKIVAGGTNVIKDLRVQSVLIEVALGTPDLDARAVLIHDTMRSYGFTVDPEHDPNGINRLFVRR